MKSWFGFLLMCTLAMNAEAQAFFHSISGRAHATSGNVTVTLGTISANDIIICTVVSEDNVSVSSVVGTGTYTAIDSGTTNGASYISSVWWVRAASGESNPLITHTAGGLITAGCWAYSGALAQGTPIGVTGTTTVNASSTSCSAMGITSNANNSLVIWAGGIASASQANTGPAPFTDRGLGGSAANPEVTNMDAVFNNGASTGTVSETWNNTAAVCNGLLFSILPANVASMGLMGVGNWILPSNFYKLLPTPWSPRWWPHFP